MSRKLDFKNLKSYTLKNSKFLISNKVEQLKKKTDSTGLLYYKECQNTDE